MLHVCRSAHTRVYADLFTLFFLLVSQDLLADGKLHVISEDEEERGRVIFLSHQWCSFLHPDPEADQLKALQVVLKRLYDGEIKVRTDPKMEMSYGYKRVDGKAECACAGLDPSTSGSQSLLPMPLLHLLLLLQTQRTNAV